MPNQFRFIAFAVGCSLHMTLLASAQAATQLGRPLDAEAGCTGMGGQGAVAVIKAGRLSGMPAVANSALPDLAKTLNRLAEKASGSKVCADQVGAIASSSKTSTRSWF
jgi:hypothetical protein